jgi:uncharacterized protein (TIGR03067 family)
MKLANTLLLIAAAANFSASIRAAEPSQKDIEAMQGAWAIESFTLDGNKLELEQLKSWQRIVENNHVVWKNGTEIMVELDIKFDPSQKPMTLDSTIATGDAKGQTALAIYELKDDELRVCFAFPDKPRPKEFSSTAGSGQSLYTAKRAKK